MTNVRFIIPLIAAISFTGLAGYSGLGSTWVRLEDVWGALTYRTSSEDRRQGEFR